MLNVERLRSVAQSLCAAAKPSYALEREVAQLTENATTCPRVMRDLECALQLLPPESTYNLRGSSSAGHVCSVAFAMPDGLTATVEAAAELPCAAVAASCLLAMAAQYEHRPALQAA